MHSSRIPSKALHPRYPHLQAAAPFGIQ